MFKKFSNNQKNKQMIRESISMNGKNKFKIVFLGDQNTGKTSIIERFIHDKFQEKANPTIGIDFLGKNVTYKNKIYRLQLWDTAGQERFRSLIPSYLKDAICAVYVFDIANRQSLENLEKWIQLFKQNKSASTVSAICANKIDLQKQYEKSRLDHILLKNKIPVFEVSSKTGQNIDEMFYSLIQMINQLINKNNKTIQQNDDDNISPPLTTEPIKLNEGGNEKQVEKKVKKNCCSFT